LKMPSHTMGSIPNADICVGMFPYVPVSQSTESLAEWPSFIRSQFSSRFILFEAFVSSFI
jgi:hypothetical protein